MQLHLLSASLILVLINLGNPRTLGSTPFKNAQADPNALPQVPDALTVPSNQGLLLKAAAKGVQIYICKAKAEAQTDYEWTLKAPSADLFNDQGQPLGKHYAGPTWEIERSKIVGAISAKVNAPQQKAIPWLLLKAKSHQGQGILGPVNWVQRLDTVGGKAPTMGCDEAHLNAEVQVPYTANYYFYRAATP
jgi:Protein of unknown function (DUF3455)